MPRYKLVVLTKPVEGREDEFNDWYTNVHIRDVLKIPGVVAAQRFHRTEQQRVSGPLQWDYLAIYECETDDLGQIVAELTARGGTPTMPISSALHDDRFVCFFEPITDNEQPTA